MSRVMSYDSPLGSGLDLQGNQQVNDDGIAPTSGHIPGSGGTLDMFLPHACNTPPEPNYQDLYETPVANCPGGISKNKRLLSAIVNFLLRKKLLQCYLEVANEGGILYERENKDCTHIIIPQNNDDATSCDLIFWPLQFRTADGKEWRFIGNGSFNVAYHDGGSLVYKLPLVTPLNKILPAYQAVSRCVRVWNEVNTKLPQPAYACGAGWVMPYILGEDLSSRNPEHVHLIVKWLLDTYNNGRKRILVDPFTKNSDGVFANFKLIKSGGDLKVACVDTDFALNISPDQNEASLASMAYWSECERNYMKIFNRDTDNEISQAVLALLAVNRFLPDVVLNIAHPDFYRLLRALANLYVKRYLSEEEQELVDQHCLSDEALATKDERGKLLVTVCQFKGPFLKKFYRGLASYPLEKIQAVTDCVNHIGFPISHLPNLLEYSVGMNTLEIMQIKEGNDDGVKKALSHAPREFVDLIMECRAKKRMIDQFSASAPDEHSAFAMNEYNTFAAEFTAMAQSFESARVEINKREESRRAAAVRFIGAAVPDKPQYKKIDQQIVTEIQPKVKESCCSCW